MKSQILWSVLFLIVVHAVLAHGKNCGLSDITSTWEEVQEAPLSPTATNRTPFFVAVTNGCKRCDAEGVTLQMINDAGISETARLKPIAAGLTVDFIFRAVGKLTDIKTLTANFVNCR